MNNVIDINSRGTDSEDILGQACDWVAKLDRELSPDERQQLGAWIARSPEHESHFLEAASMMDKLDQLSRLESMFPEQVDQKPARQKWLGAMAASFVLCVSALLLTMNLQQRDNDSFIASHQTAIGDKSTVHLPDGSTLILNTDSAVDINYDHELRRIHLHKGELHIDVAHNKEIPLQVIVNDKVIQAVGTAFNVQYVNDSVELIVTDGVVQLGQQASTEKSALPVLVDRQLSEGQQVQFSNDASLASQQILISGIDDQSLSSTLSWQRDRLVFNGDKLHTVLNEISRYSDITFDIANDPKVRDLQIAGVFQTNDVEKLLEVLRSSFNLQVERQGNSTIRLSAG